MNEQNNNKPCCWKLGGHWAPAGALPFFFTYFDLLFQLLGDVANPARGSACSLDAQEARTPAV